MGALVAGKDFADWAESLMLAFARYFDALIKGQMAAISAMAASAELSEPCD